VRIVVPMKTVPDLAEEIELMNDDKAIDHEQLTFVVNEWDAQALEEALILKEETGASVTAVGLATDPEIDQVLFVALAKGADAAVKLVGDATSPVQGPTAAALRAGLLAGYLGVEPADLVLTGVQANDDLDGQLAPLLGALLGLPHVSVVVSVRAEGAAVRARQEFAGGRSHDLEVSLPAVIGVQSGRRPPRYAPISRVKQAMSAGALSELAAEAPPGAEGVPTLVVRRLRPPEQSGRAEMLAGGPGEVADRIVALLRDRGLIKEAR